MRGRLFAMPEKRFFVFGWVPCCMSEGRFGPVRSAGASRVVEYWNFGMVGIPLLSGSHRLQAREMSLYWTCGSMRIGMLPDSAPNSLSTTSPYSLGRWIRAQQSLLRVGLEN